MLPEISNNAKNYLNGINPFIQQRLFNINTQTKVVSQTLFINKDNKLNIQERLDSDKISIAKSKSKPRKTISSVPPTNNNIKSVKEKVKYTDTPVRSKPTKKSGNKLNNRKMTKIQTPKAKKVVATQKRNVPKKSSNNKATKKINKVSNNRMSKTVDETSYFTRQLEEIKIEELLLTNETQISIVSGPSSCGKTKLIQNALQTLDIDYVILESGDFKNLDTLYRTLKYQISPAMGNRRSSRNSVIDEDTVLDLLRSIPEQIPIVIDDAYSLFNYVHEEDEDENISLKINPVIFEWIYDCLENDKKLNMILVSSNPLVECWIDINIPNEIVCHCPIKDLTYDEAQDFFYSYLYEKGIDSIDLTFEDVYPITGTRISIIKKFIQEYIQKSDEDFNDLDFSMVNELYNKLNKLLDSTEQPQLLKRIMAIMVSESDRGYVEEKELEYIFQNNQSFMEEESSRSSIRKMKKSSQPGSDDFWEIIAMLIENHLLNRNIMEFTSPEPLPSSSSSRQYTQANNNPVIIKRPVLFPENQCVIYAMDLILKDNNIQINH
jgi:hypothetical protein